MNGAVAQNLCSIGAGILKWECKCQKCSAMFEIDVPRGPREEKNMKCPLCGANDIHRVNVPDLSHTACGG